jgi:hypothetical protein
VRGGKKASVKGQDRVAASQPPRQTVFSTQSVASYNMVCLRCADSGKRTHRKTEIAEQNPHPSYEIDLSGLLASESALVHLEHWICVRSRSQCIYEEI